MNFDKIGVLEGFRNSVSVDRNQVQHRFKVQPSLEAALVQSWVAGQGSKSTQQNKFSVMPPPRNQKCNFS